MRRVVVVLLVLAGLVSPATAAAAPRAAPGALPSDLSLGMPATVSAATPVTVVARLVDADATPLTRRTVSLFAATAADGPFSRVATVTTGRHGTASVREVPLVTTWYQWRFAGDDAYAPQTSPARRIVVTQTVGIEASATEVASGASVTLWGILTPPVSGLVVRVQRFDGATWRSTPYTATSADQTLPDGTTAVGYVVTFVPVTGAYRVLSPADATNARGFSDALTITVQ